MTHWMKGPPRTEGRYWYWLLGSGMVRSQEVFRHLDRGLCVDSGEGPFSVKGPLRLWARGLKRPQVPSEDEMEALDVRRKAL